MSMQHLQRTTCCDHEFTPTDIKPPLVSAQQAFDTQERLYGGNAKWFARASCPDCGRQYWLWLMPIPRGYKVLTISAVEGQDEQDEPFDIETADKAQLRKYLNRKGIAFFNGASEDQLRELARGTLALL